MSGFIGIAGQDRAFVFADGAGYDDEGRLMNISTKIAVSAEVPFAVTGQGNTAFLDPIKAFLCQQADRIGVEAMIDEFIPDFLAEMGAKFQDVAVGHGAYAMQIAGYSPSKGAFLKQFQSIPEPDRPDLDVTPYSLRDLGATSIRGPQFPSEWLLDLRPPVVGEDLEEYARYFGLIAMEMMRAVPTSSLHDPDSAKTPKIGGHVDMAVVDANGVRVERIHTWADEIGKTIEINASIIGRKFQAARIAA